MKDILEGVRMVMIEKTRLLYKYIDSNLFALLTRSGENLNLYIINGVTGQVKEMFY